MGWGNSFDKPEFKQTEKQTIIYSGPNLFPEINHVRLFVDIQPQLDELQKYQFKNKEDEVSANTEQLIKAYATVRNRNLKPTHDPYTNPNAHIYYECACGAILDPQTKSFAALNNHASDKGWKIRFTDKGYVPYCVKCGEKIDD